MTIRNLEYMFGPKSVAVIGASNRPLSVGATVMRNLRSAGFKGTVMPVNPKYDEVAGIKAYRKLSKLPEPPQLAIICTPADAVPGIVSELGNMGTRAAVVLTAGLKDRKAKDGRTLQQEMIDAAGPHMLRILGPNCLGLIIPGIALNASFAHTSALPGSIAFITQSGALATAILDWAGSRGIGFSHFVSLGNSADVDFGDVLDYLGSDPKTSAILLYIEAVTHARKFMSAARAAARNKPVLAVKSGRAPEGAKAAASHTGALAGADDVYDAAIRRAGMLRVMEIEDLFDAVETLARARPLAGDRLAILTNGGGPGVMAVDTLVQAGGRLAAIAPETVRRLDEILPAAWSRANPVDIIGDAPVERYVETLKILSRDPGIDAVLFIHAPTAIVPSGPIAEALAPVIKDMPCTVLACWLGAAAVAGARRLFSDNGIPTYDTPEDGVRAFMQMVGFRRNQELLREVPPSICEDVEPDTMKARRVVEAVLAEGRGLLTEPEAKAVLEACCVPVVKTKVVKDADGAARAAEEIGFPVAVKILSRNITHKSDVGGVALDVETCGEARDAVEAMARRIGELKPGAVIDGYTVQKMARKPEGHELIVGVASDPVFGPVILFGHGGTAVEVIADRAMALPPLNAILAREMISRTRIARMLAGYRNRPPADMDAICRTLIQVSGLAADLPQIMELDINPLLADDRGVVALDARIRVAPAEGAAADRFAVKPYPRQLEERIDFQGRNVVLRPIRPEDELAHREFFSRLQPEDVRLRFFVVVRALSKKQFARLMQIDYDREMAFIASARTADGRPETLGVVRVVADPDNAQAEFAIIVRSDLKGKGLGSILAEKMIRYCRGRGIKELYGDILSENKAMLALARKLGFHVASCPEAGLRQVCLKLDRSEP